MCGAYDNRIIWGMLTEPISLPYQRGMNTENKLYEYAKLRIEILIEIVGFEK